jgi:hypothetical protein
MPFYPQFDRNPLDLANEAERAVAAGEATDVAGLRRRPAPERQHDCATRCRLNCTGFRRRRIQAMQAIAEFEQAIMRDTPQSHSA